MLNIFPHTFRRFGNCSAGNTNVSLPSAPALTSSTQTDLQLRLHTKRHTCGRTQSASASQCRSADSSASANKCQNTLANFIR